MSSQRLTVASEPDYADQVPRREAFEAAHPEVEILYHGPHWRAVIRRDGTEDVPRELVCYSLRQLLDKLEKAVSDRPAPKRQAAGS